jgi:Tfp pilus assembly protein PilN
MFELKSKLTTGVSLEDDKLRVATVTFNKGKMKVMRLNTVTLVTPVRKGGASTINQPLVSDQPIEPSSLLLDLDDDMGSAPPKPSVPSIDGDFDMSKDIAIEGIDIESNASQMAEILNGEDSKSVNIALNIPIGESYFQVVSDINHKKLGKKKTHKELKERVTAYYGQMVSDDQVRYYVRDDGTLFVASIGTSIESLDILDSALPIYMGKVNVREIIPDEAVLVGLTRANYKLQDQQYTCIIHAEDSRTAVLFLQGKRVHTILPVINEGRNNPKFVRTVFSKILFEIDRGKIPTLDQVIITSDTPDEQMGNYLREQFIDIDVEAFQFNPDIFEIDETIEIGELQDHLRAIGVAWAAGAGSESDFPGLSFVPERVLLRQQVFKLGWHGYVLLAIIALFPLVFNYRFQNISTEYDANQQTIDFLDTQIAETKPIADTVDQFMADFNDYSARLGLLDDLSAETQKWSTTLTMVNKSTQEIRSIWIRSLASQPTGGILIQGSSLSRDRIPMISESFENAVILSVQERDGRPTVFDFTLLVTKIVADESIFNPPRPVYRDPATAADTLGVPVDSTAINIPGE